MVNQGDVVNRLRLELETMLRENPELAEDDVLLADMLEGATDIREVLINLGRVLDDASALEEGVIIRINDLSVRKERFVARGEFIRSLIFKVMESAQLKKIELPEVTLSLRNNPPRLVGDADPATLPDDLCAIKRSVDRKAVRAAIEAGKDIPGFVLSNAAPSLTVRVK